MRNLYIRVLVYTYICHCEIYYEEQVRHKKSSRETQLKRNGRIWWFVLYRSNNDTKITADS